MGIETEQSHKNNCSLSAYQESGEGWDLPPTITSMHISTGIYLRSWETSA